MDRPRSWRVQGIDLSSEPPLRIGGAEIDPVSREARSTAGTERLQPQNLKVLIALARRKGAVVTRGTLIDLCWDGRIVGEDVINHSISVLRAFAASVGGFTIETVPKAGYRLVEEEQVRPAPARRTWALAATAGLLASGGAVWYLVDRSPPPANPAREMQVRLSGFTALSPGISAGLLQSLRDETLAAFADDGAIGVAAAAPSGADAQPYRLGGSVEHLASGYKVLLRIDNAATGASLWSHGFDYADGDANKVAREVSVNLANMTRCGFGRSVTHSKPLPDATLRLLFAGCQNDGTIDTNLDRALDYARRVTAASPDFSAGWSSVAATAVVLGPQKPPTEAAAMELEARRALDRALRLDPKNSEAWALKAYVLPIVRFSEREVFLKRAIAARPLDCGCEHHGYGVFLNQVGRLREAAREYRRAVDFMHLNEGMYEELAPAQFAMGERQKALDTLAAGERVGRHPEEFDVLRARFALWAGDYRAAGAILDGKRLSADPTARLMRPVVRALASGNSAAIAQARSALLSRVEDPDTNRPLPISLLATLGDTENALAALRRLASTDPAGAYRTLFDPAFDRSRNDPAYWATARHLGLVDYWTATRHPPDFCKARTAPQACAQLR